MSNFFSNNSLLTSSVAPSDWYWDANGNSSGIGGTGTLDDQSFVVRKSSSTGPLTIYPNDQIKNNTMIFDGVGGTVTFPAFSFSPLKVMNFNKIIVKTNNYILSQYAIEFVKNNPEIYIESGVVCRSNRYLKSSTTLTKSGLGTLVLRDSFFLMNSLYIKEGVIKYQAPDNYATHHMPPININTNSSLIIAISTVTNSIFGFPNNFSGNGIIQRDPNSPTVYPPTGNSTMAITGNNINFTGEWRFNAGYGYVLFSNDNAVGAPNVGIRCSGASAGFYFNTSGNTLASTRTITLVGGCNLFWNGAGGNSNTIASLITGAGSLTKQSYETHILTNNNNYTGSTYVRGTGTTSGSADSILRVSSGSLGGTAGLTADFGNIVFQNNNTNGILEFVTAANLGICSQIRFRNSGGVIGYGGALRYIGSTNETVSKTIQCDTSIGIRLESNSTGSGSITYNGTMSQTNRGLYLGGTGVGIFNNLFAGTGPIVKRDSGTWTIGNSNTYSGGTTINGGTIVVNNTNALGTNTVTVNSGATLNLNGFTIPNTIVNNGGTIIP